ncbi:MAG: hypothetical protein ACPG80_05885 [Rickettsiales bacterium]
MDYTPYSPDMDANTSAAAGVGHKGSNKLPTHLIITAVMTFIMVGSILLLIYFFPSQFRSLLLAIDRFGVTEVGAQEQQRVRTINKLPITYEEKQVLINRTVFFGATQQMVVLALGQPFCSLNTQATVDQPPTEYWVYYIAGDVKPTRLSFQNDVLIAAGKQSALDLCDK